MNAVKRFHPGRIIVEEAAAHLPLTQTIIGRLTGVPLDYVSDDAVGSSGMGPGGEFGDEPSLLLCRNRGRFFEPCPCTKHYLGCGYTILNFAANCHLNCTYCILQAYLNNPHMVVYTNSGEMFRELDDVFNHPVKKLYRVGTGEYTDSLILDHLTSFTGLVVPYFRNRKNAYLELKTKTDNIDNLEGLDHGGKTIVSWSLNAEPVVRGEERHACSLEERINAARRCQGWGYAIGFHFDPLIYYPGWERDYRPVIEKVFQAIDPASLCWISLGCFRFMPKLKPIIMKRYPESRILYQEFIRGHDGKMRYFQPIRIEMYRKMAEWIRGASRKTFIYLCMESKEVWERSLGCAPLSNQDLSSRLDAACSVRRD